MKQTAMLIEDDPDTQNIVEYWLTSAGFQFFSTRTGTAGLQLIEESPPDILVLDLSLPDMDGMDICRHVREHTDVPIIMLTGRLGDRYRLAGFELGIDDYISKPFNPKELVARVRAVLRRAQPSPLNGNGNGGQQILQFQDVSLDISKFRVFRGEIEIFLTSTEFKLLVLLMKDPGRLVSREEAMSVLYGSSYERDARTVDSHVSHLRGKLFENESNGFRIQNIYGMGYRLVV